MILDEIRICRKIEVWNNNYNIKQLELNGMEKVTASDAIVEIAGSLDTSGKLNMWANIIKWIVIFISIIVILVGLTMLFGDKYERPTGLLLVILGVIEAFVAFFYVYMLRAFAIITEAASIIVLEHKNKSEE